jgi:CRP-like cAMP-binding protein
MQVVGSGLTMPVAALRAAVARSDSLGSLMLRYVECFGIQVAHTAVTNARGSLEQRLARWILMARDRVPGDALALTHEFLSLMLGVRRAGVTVSLNALAQRGVVRSAGTGHLEVVDREALEAIAASFYGVPEREYARLLR